MTALRCLLAALLVVVQAGLAAAAPPHGLMWAKGDLPRIFPLQVRTPPGRDAYLVLRDAASDRAVLAAYIEGGRFFRVLVPPGTFMLDIAIGADWQGEEALFGPATAVYAHPEPLEFGITGAGRKSGHLIDLRDAATGIEARSDTLALCQRYALDLDAFGGALPEEASRPDLLHGTAEPDPLEEGPFLRREWRYDLDERLCG